MPCQYGEEPIILEHLQKHGIERGGFVVDVGAADGVTNSNSRFLIEDYGWRGIMIEPLPEHAEALRELYAGSPDVQVLQVAAYNDIGEKPMWLYPSGQVSTLKASFMESSRRAYGAVYDEPIRVNVAPLMSIFADCQCPAKIDFLTIDCEGVDGEVVESMDWRSYDVGLVCVENGFPKSKAGVILAAFGYSMVGQTAGNVLWSHK